VLADGIIFFSDLWVTNNKKIKIKTSESTFPKVHWGSAVWNVAKQVPATKPVALEGRAPARDHIPKMVSDFGTGGVKNP